MSDPAIEAAERASLLSGGGNVFIMADGIAAAREALKPIREKWLDLLAVVGPGGYDVLVEIQPLIFTSEEIAKWVPK